jgi:hypothetical protein
MNRLVPLALVCLVASISVGCGENGPQRYQLSGKVSMDGVPIPYGEIIITPDASKKNSGPQGRAPIVNGVFDTAASDGLGIGGGPVLIRVNGMSGPRGKTLCEYEFSTELPPSSSTKDIVVPKKDAHNANPYSQKNAPEI